MNSFKEANVASDTSYVHIKGQVIVNSSVTTQSSPVVLKIHPISASTQSTESLILGQKQTVTSASTKLSEHSNPLSLKMKAIFWTAKEEIFEDGMESKFSQVITFFVKKYGDDALNEIISLIFYEKVEPEVAGEALRWLGRIEHTESYEHRRWILENSLKLSSSRVRDGAILGLASMDDKHAIPYLKLAIEKEECSELKADMETVLEQLEM